jgi:hypothetical protein
VSVAGATGCHRLTALACMSVVPHDVLSGVMMRVFGGVHAGDTALHVPALTAAAALTLGCMTQRTERASSATPPTVRTSPLLLFGPSLLHWDLLTCLHYLRLHGFSQQSK